MLLKGVFSAYDMFSGVFRVAVVCRVLVIVECLVTQAPEAMPEQHFLRMLV